MNDNQITVVFSYIAGKSNEDGLKLSLRSLHNFVQDHNVVIIGDRPEWLSEDVTVIDHPAAESLNQTKIEHFKLAIESESVSSDFILMPENVFFVSRTLLADVIILKTEGEIAANSAGRKRTVDVLTAGGYGTLDFCTYTPYFLSKQGLTDLLTDDAVKELVSELDLISLYFNVVAKGYSALKLDFKRDNIKLPVYSETPDPVLFKKYVEGKKFLHNMRGSKAVYDYLWKAFPHESVYEK